MEDRPAARALDDVVVAGYGERRLTSALPPLAERRWRHARVPRWSVQQHLNDPAVEEIWFNERPRHG